MKIILDTNVVVSGIFWSGPPYEILSAWKENEFQVIITKEIYKEYLRVINKISEDQNITDEWAVFILNNSTAVKDKKLFDLSKDKTDNKFLNAAKISNSNFLVSGDEDLLELNEKINIDIVEPRPFLERL